MSKEIDYLTEDPVLSNQQWVCMSFLSPEGVKNCNIRGVKVRGIYATQKEANERAKYLQELDGDFHVFVGEVGKWLSWDPDPQSIDDQIYKEKELNDLMKSYKENMAKAKVEEAHRKKTMIENSLLEELENTGEKSKNSQTIQNRLKKKLADRSDKSKIELIETEEQLVDVEKLEEDKKVVDLELNRLSNNENSLNESKNNIKVLEDNMDKIQKLYKQLHEKKSNNI
jgi:hypothetical protein